MSRSTNLEFRYGPLATLLRTLRRKKHISLNQLAQATGISRRTLARLEKVTGGPCSVTRGGKTTSANTGHPSASLRAGRTPATGHRPSPRTAYRLARTLLGEKETSRWLEDQSRLSRFLGSDPLYKFLDVVYHYPSFLFHDSPAQQALRAEFGHDYTHSLDLLLRSGFGSRNLGARLRAFRLQHDLTLVETAALLDLSKSELHRLERSERRPSPRTRYRILRLLTLPLGLAGQPFRADIESAAGTASLEGVRGNPCRVSPPLNRPTRSFDSAQDKPVGRRRHEPAVDTQRDSNSVDSAGLKPRPTGLRVATLKAARALWLEAIRAALAAPPPSPDSATPRPFDSSDPLQRLRHAWLAGRLSARQLARQLGISQPHLIRLLRGDRKPSRRLQERLGVLVR